MDRGAGEGGDNTHAARQERQRALALRIEQSFGQQPVAELREREVESPLTVRF